VGTNQPQGEIEPGYRIQSTIVKPRPDEQAFALTRDKYDLLKQGDVPEEKQSRDVCLGILAGSLIGFLTSDWHLTWKLFLLGLICLVAGLLAAFFAFKIRKRKGDAGCMRIKKEIDSHFNDGSQ
jgi:F0F1-type ATP synthase assembly protein I